MNESAQNNSGVGAVLGMLLIFLIIIYFVFRFGGSTQTVQGTVETQNSASSTSQVDTGSDLYNKYIQQLFDNQKINGSSSQSQIISNFQGELDDKISVPNFSQTIPDVNIKYLLRIYNNSFEQIFRQEVSKGMASETIIFADQIKYPDLFIPLSVYDKETIVNSASEYENFARQIQNLPTPTIYQKRAEVAVNNSLAVAYILRKMVTEPDEQIYKLWITKYSAYLSDIMLTRYAQK